MAGELDNLRRTLSNTARSAWSGADGAKNALESTLDSHGDEIEDCIDEADVQSCLENLFEREGLGDDISADWDGSDFAEVISNLRSISDQWSRSARNEVASVASDNDLDELHRMCMSGQVQDVTDEINVDSVEDELQSRYGFSAPSNGRQCLQTVSLVKDIASELKETWGTA